MLLVFTTILFLLIKNVSYNKCGGVFFRMFYPPTIFVGGFILLRRLTNVTTDCANER